nr:calcium-dependent secretion activator 2-like [Chelonoidis abingdonii]
MLDPSSSEEESDEVLEEEKGEVLLVAPGGCSGSLPRVLPAPNRDPRAREPGRQGSGPARPASPSPSVLSEGREERERLQKEEREKRLRLQLYVFIVRCIAYPFNAKQPTDMARRQQKGASLNVTGIDDGRLSQKSSSH